MTDKIVIIASVKPLEYQGKVTGRLVTDKAGDEHKVKKGQGGCLKDRWEELDNGVGNAICLKMDKYEGHDYVADFEWVKDVFVQEAAEKVSQPSRERSIETQVAIKEIGECWRAGVVNLEEHKPLILSYLGWITDRLGDWYDIAKVHVEARDESNRPLSRKDEQPDRQDPDREETGQLPLTEDRKAQRKRIQFLAIKAGYNKESQKLWDAWLELNYKKTDISKFSQEELDKLEEQLKKEAK